MTKPSRIALALLLAIAVGAPSAAHAAEMPRKTRLSVMRGVVKLIVMQRTAYGYRRVGHGSGTVINSSGLILTNNHVVARRGGGLWDAVAVAPTTSFQHSPKPVCLAFPSRALRDSRLDLALLRCEATMTGRPLRRRIAWSPVRIGRSTALTPGDSLFVVGYPTIGGGEITFTSGEVSGFTRNVKGRWIKTTAMIGKGVSGGGAFNQHGELVGVPTLQRWRRNERVVLGLARPVAAARSMLAAVKRQGLRAAVAARHGSAPRYAQAPRAPYYGRTPYYGRAPSAPRYEPLPPPSYGTPQRRHPRFGSFDGFFDPSPRTARPPRRHAPQRYRPAQPPRADIDRYRQALRRDGLQI
ncbi:MAG: trypsin-like peptidase domain-containing protein [Myxococcales bacterium]|nr:trypsin-like peptidase domain-containing protein [Myxococcales bacterium]